MNLTLIIFINIVLLFFISCGYDRGHIEAHVENQKDIDKTIKNPIVKEKKKKDRDDYIQLQQALVTDTIQSLDTLFLNYMNTISKEGVKFSFLESNSFDSLANLFLQSPNQQRQFIKKDSSINVKLASNDSSSKILFNDKVIHEWSDKNWWMSYRYLGYCENGEYDWFQIGNESIEYAIFLKDGTQLDYPFIFSENQKHKYYICSFEGPSTYSTYIIMDDIINISLEDLHLVLRKSFWITNNQLVFSLSQKRDIDDFNDSESNILRTIYIKVEII